MDKRTQRRHRVLTTEEAWQKISTKIAKDESGCWTYVGRLDRYGYGKVDIPKMTITHRVAYEALVGPIPDGLVIDHLCRNRACCNPDHLEPVTNRANLMRGETDAARRAAQTHCIHGHEFSVSNTRIRKDGTRTCIECSREAVRRYRAKRGIAA